MWRKWNTLEKNSYYMPPGNAFIIIVSKIDPRTNVGKQMLSIACLVVFICAKHSFTSPVVYLEHPAEERMLWTLLASHNNRVDYCDPENEVSFAYERSQ